VAGSQKGEGVNEVFTLLDRGSLKRGTPRNAMKGQGPGGSKSRREIPEKTAGIQNVSSRRVMVPDARHLYATINLRRWEERATK